MPNESDEPRGRTERSGSKSETAMTSSAQPHGSRIVQSHLVAAVTREEETILVDVNGGRVLRLDAFGSRVWPLLADRPTLPILVERLRDSGMRTEQLAERVAQLLARWCEKGVVTWR